MIEVIQNGIVPGLHFEKLIENVIDPLKPVKANIEYKDGGVYITVFPEDNVPVQRVAFISEIDHHGKFRVTISKLATEFEYEIEKSVFEINATYDPNSPHYEVTPTDMAYFYRRMNCFFIEHINPNFLPPKDLIDKRNHINDQWLSNSNAKVQLYLQDKRDGDWRFRIVHNSGTTIVSYLDTIVTGHTCNMFVSAAEDAFKRGLLEGRVSYAESIAREAFQKATSDLQGYYVEAFAPEIHSVIKSGQFRKNRHSI